MSNLQARLTYNTPEGLKILVEIPQTGEFTIGSSTFPLKGPKGQSLRPESHCVLFHQSINGMHGVTVKNTSSKLPLCVDIGTGVSRSVLTGCTVTLTEEGRTNFNINSSGKVYHNFSLELFSIKRICDAPDEGPASKKVRFAHNGEAGAAAVGAEPVSAGAAAAVLPGQAEPVSAGASAAVLPAQAEPVSAGASAAVLPGQAEPVSAGASAKEDPKPAAAAQSVGVISADPEAKAKRKAAREAAEAAIVASAARIAAAKALAPAYLAAKEAERVARKAQLEEEATAKAAAKAAKAAAKAAKRSANKAGKEIIARYQKSRAAESEIEFEAGTMAFDKTTEFAQDSDEDDEGMGWGAGASADTQELGANYPDTQALVYEKPNNDKETDDEESDDAESDDEDKEQGQDSQCAILEIIHAPETLKINGVDVPFEGLAEMKGQKYLINGVTRVGIHGRECHIHIPIRWALVSKQHFEVNLLSPDNTVEVSVKSVNGLLMKNSKGEAVLVAREMGGDDVVIPFTFGDEFSIPVAGDGNDIEERRITFKICAPEAAN